MRLFTSYLPELDAMTIQAELIAAEQACRRAESCVDAVAGPRRIHCPVCRIRLRVPDGAAGRAGRCRRCGAEFVIPPEPEPAVPHPMASA